MVFYRNSGLQVVGVTTSSNGLHMASKGRQFIRVTKLLMAKITLKDVVGMALTYTYLEAQWTPDHMVVDAQTRKW